MTVAIPALPFGVGIRLPDGPHPDDPCLMSAVGNTSLKNFPFPVRLQYQRGFGLAIYVDVPDREHGQPTQVVHMRPRNHYVFSCEEEALHWLRHVLQEVVLHELDEALHYKGDRVFDPHKIGVQSLLNK